MYRRKTREQRRLQDTLETLRFLNADSEVSLYLYDLAMDRVYFADSFDEKYNLPTMRNGSCTMGELMNILHKWNVSAADAGLRDLPEEIKQISHGEYWLTAGSGETVLLKNEIRIEYGENGKPCWVIGRLTDALTGKNIDSLTGLFDAEKMAEDLRVSKSQGRQGSLMVLGIDNFRDINTRHGRGYGNQVIKSVAEVLEQVSGSVSGLYRLDSDKFAMHNTGGEREELEALYSRIQEGCARFCTLFAGVALYGPNTPGDVDEIYQRAENTLNQAKRQGKNMMLFFSADAFEHQLSMLDLQEELKESVAQGCRGFVLHYQPQIACGNYRIFGVEALLRYCSPSRGMVRPDEFISILEQTGMMVEVGAWVLKTALAQCRAWRQFLPQLHVSVNVSYVQLQEKDAAERILAILEESGVPGTALTLEVTESIQLQDVQYFNKIFYKLEKHGIQIAVDDFGTGYSSLSYLKRLAIDEIKIDRCFVSRIQNSSYNYRLLSNMIELARSAQIRVCCEGVETEQELTVLTGLRPDLMQGFLFARPWDPEQFARRYLDESTEEYAQCRRQEEYFRGLQGRFNAEDIERAEHERLSTVVDSMDELVYVRSLESCELLYMNAAGREMTGMYDYRGCKCYKVLMNRDTPCENCLSCGLDAEEYRVREKLNPYLKKHFMLKEKLIPWQGQIAGLTVAIDVTEQEITTKRVQEKLEFQRNIVECTQLLLHEPDIRKAVSGLLQSIGTFYQADRAYLFEMQDNGLYWDNTYEWCAEGTPAQMENLQEVPMSVTERWMELFRKGQSVVIGDLEEIRDISPKEWEILKPQGVRNLIASPVWRNQKIIGFLGVDNPSAHALDEGQIQTIACFLADRILKDKTQNRLTELLDMHHEDILKTTNLGLWVICLSRDGTRAQMYVDQTMRSILGIRGELTPEECYDHWYGRINDGYHHYVNFSVRHMIDTGNTVELSYTWNHPLKGEVTVRCLGIRVEDMGDRICLKGYHREINEVDRPGFLPDDKSIIFEYNENKGSIYFHNDRAPLAGEAEKEENFPACWLKNGMVHPHFAGQFRSIFTDVQNQPEQEGQEFLLKAASGSYEWFKLKTRHLGRDAHDVNTVIVILDPAKQERAMELEFMRQKDFYGAILAEKIAYAEIDMESHKFLSLGGLWSDYAETARQEDLPYEKLLLKYANLLVHPEDLRNYRDFIRDSSLRRIMEKPTSTGKLQLRRLIDGEMRWVELTGHVFQDKLTENLYALLYMRDIDARKRRELEQEEAATRDPLTRVLNRAAFEERVSGYIQEPGMDNCGTLLLIDMDDFKEINDNFGHGEGDRILLKISDLLMTTFRREDLVGRFGGDEFMVFLKNMTDKPTIRRRLLQLYEGMEQVEGRPVSCSIGATVVHREGYSFAASLWRADEALYKSKEQNKHTYCYFEDL